MYSRVFDVVVVGGGHAGCEAAAAAANMGSKTLLVTMNMQTIGQMSCNPAMGGVAKGQILREIDALGGYSGVVSDLSSIQFRMLNRSKGPAMWSPRSQNDRFLFAQEWRKVLEGCENLSFFQDSAISVKTKRGVVSGIKTSLGVEIKTKTVVLTNGTFLNGVIHVGGKSFGGGRAGERASFGITECLSELGFSSGRMKTGTPPRVDGRSLDFSKMERQEGDKEPGCFSFLNTSPLTKQRPCYITHTNKLTHDILRDSFSDSPLFNGQISGAGPRYCPSIEDKIDRFAEKERHQLFVEPEGWETIEYYINGFSTSLPEKTQVEALRSVVGFENVAFFRPGYAIEYDYFPPTQLSHTLETTLVGGLFFSGQINGTTGYEEAACQGLIAGINAHLKTQKKDPFVLSRSEGYIGVLIDDLITKGIDEPYRMFTSRSEHRMLLRQDNADERLTPLGIKLGLVSKKREQIFLKKQEKRTHFLSFLKKYTISKESANKILFSSLGGGEVNAGLKAAKLLKRPGISVDSLFLDVKIKKEKEKLSISKEVTDSVGVVVKYESYIKRENENVKKTKNLSELKIPDNFDYKKISSLSYEGRDKLIKKRPKTIGQASRIGGVSASDVSVLLVYMGR